MNLTLLKYYIDANLKYNEEFTNIKNTKVIHNIISISQILRMKNQL